MTIRSESLANVVFPNSETNTAEIERTTVSYVKERLLNVEQDPRLDRYTLTEVEIETLTNWRNTALAVLTELECQDLIASIPQINELVFYTTKVSGTEGTINSCVDTTGQKIVFVLGEKSQIDSDTLRKVYHHEIAHIITQRVLKLDEHNIPTLMQLGFERITSITTHPTQEGTTQILHSKVALAEPLADIFAFYCSDKMGISTHYMDTPYIREVCFVLGMLDKICVENSTGIKEEFGILFRMFCHRDFSWFKYAHETFTKIAIEEGETPENARDKATEFLRSLNNMEVEQGIDVIHEPEYNKWGYNLEEIAGKGGFLENYEDICNCLVSHRRGIKFRGTNTYIM